MMEGGEGDWRYLGAPLSHLFINTDPVNALASSTGSSEEQVRLQKTSCRSEAEPQAGQEPDAWRFQDWLQGGGS